MTPYKECASCLATNFCKRFSGEIERPPNWCNVRFRLEKALQLSLIPKMFWKANIYNYKVDKYNEKAYQQIKGYADNIVDVVNNGYNFYFYSELFGTGKTFHGALILNHFIYKTCITSLFDFEHPLALFVVYADLMDKLRYEKEDTNLDLVKNVPLLLLDDIGSGTMSDYIREQTYLILNHRFNYGLSTVITSNYTLVELANPSKLGERNASRIASNCVPFRLDSPDRRIQGGH